MGTKLVALTHVPSPAMDACVRTHAAHETIDLDRANTQHEGYRAALTRAGAEVTLLDVNARFPDCVFIEDTAIVLDEIAVVTPMGTPSRAGEPAAIEATLRAYKDVVRVLSSASLEGGDVLRVGHTLLVGSSARTNARGIEALASIVRPHGYAVRAVPVYECLHLKTACTALPDGRLLVNSAWLDPTALAGFDVVEVAEGEPHAANVVLVGERVLTGAGAPRTAETIRSLGFDLDVVDLSEFAKGDGCGTCLSLVFQA